MALLLLFLDTAMYIQIKSYYPDLWKKEEEVEPVRAPALDESQQRISQALSSLKLNSRYLMVIDLADQQVLYEKNSDKKLYPASLTKVLSAIVALDNAADLQQKVTITKKDIEGLEEAHASVAGLEVGDTLTIEDLLYALILPSGADGANALGNHLNGSVSDFVEDMNQKAVAMGMVNTHFQNATGLHDKQHYTTLQDIKKMMDHAWKNPTFRKVLTTLQYTIPSNKQHPKGLKLESTLLHYSEDLSFDGGKIIGGKSGFTPEAGYCLISVAEMDDGKQYMVISAKAQELSSTKKNGEITKRYGSMTDAKSIYSTIASTRKQETK